MTVIDGYNRLDTEIWWLQILHEALNHKICDDQFTYKDENSVYSQNIGTVIIGSPMAWLGKFATDTGIRYVPRFRVTKTNDMEFQGFVLSISPKDLFYRISLGFDRFILPELNGISLIDFIFNGEAQIKSENHKKFLIDEIIHCQTRGWIFSKSNFEEVFGHQSNNRNISRLQTLRRINVCISILKNIKEHGYYKNRNRTARIRNWVARKAVRWASYN